MHNKTPLFTVQISIDPQIKFNFYRSGKGNMVFEELCIKSGPQNLVIETSEWEWGGVGVFIRELDKVKNDEIDRSEWGGSEGDFSETVAITKTTFSLLLHHFGDTFMYDNSWTIQLDVKYDRVLFAKLFPI